jgi:hypothetical protein
MDTNGPHTALASIGIDIGKEVFLTGPCGLSYVAQQPSLWTLEETIKQFPLHHRRQDGEYRRGIEKQEEPEQRIADLQHCGSVRGANVQRLTFDGHRIASTVDSFQRLREPQPRSRAIALMIIFGISASQNRDFVCQCRHRSASDPGTGMPINSRGIE